MSRHRLEVGLPHAEQLDEARKRAYDEGWNAGRKDGAKLVWATLVRFAWWMGRKKPIDDVERFFREDTRNISND